MLTRRTKIAYGFGQFMWATKDTAFHYFIFFYYTTFMGLSGSLAGLGAMLALIADGVSDPLIGQISDNWKRGKWGRRHPFMIAGMVPYVVGLYAIFNPPVDLSQGQLFAWFLGFAILVRTCLTFFTVPHMSLGAELSPDYQERTSIATIRNICGYSGGLTMQVLAWFLIIPMAIAAGDAGAGYRNVAYAGIAIALIGGTVAILGTRDRIPHLVSISSAQAARPWYMAFVDILQVLKLRSGRILFFGTLIVTSKVGITNTLLIHVNTFHYGFSSQQTGIFMLAVAAALIPSFFIATKASALMGKRRAVVLCLAVCTCVWPLAPLAHLYGLTPATGSVALLAVVCLGVFAYNSFYVAFINVSGAMLPDVVDESELETGMRQEGIFNAAFMLTQKVTFGVGVLIAGIVIDYAGMNGITDIATVTDQMASRLILVYSIGGVSMIFIGCLIYGRYSLSETRHTEIREELMSSGHGLEAAAPSETQT